MSRQAATRKKQAGRVWLALTLALSAPVAAGAFEAGADAEAQRLLSAAFERRYSCAITGVVRISTRKGEARARDRRLHIAAKFVRGKLHTYAIFREPQYVRGMAFLGVESDDPHLSEQQFVYLPSMDKVRRLSGSQPTDSFLGTDLSYHDFQRQHPERYRATEITAGRAQGEAIRTVSVVPLFDAPYSLAEYEIAVADEAILGARYFKRLERGPYREMRMPREGIVTNDTCSVPTRVIVDDNRRGTHTELDIAELRTNADLDDSLFTYSALEARRDIPGIRDR
jgi:Outer membrane lipoprotein-sorting protein